MFSIVGLPDSAVRESTERVRAAIKNGQFDFPMRRITVNLAPADVRKIGAAFDLAIAVGIMVTSHQWPARMTEETLFLGELSLVGDVRSVPGVLSMTQAARDAGLQQVVVPWDNAEEAACVPGIRIIPIRRLADLATWNGTEPIASFSPRHEQAYNHVAVESSDFVEVVGQTVAKRALTIAVAGMHNIVFVGPPGSGKTMLMRRIPSILPPLSDEEALEVTKIYSVSNQSNSRAGFIRNRPFRAPHHHITIQGLIGGGARPTPGEVSLAHHGVLFLDEWPEFPRVVLESLRQPMEDGRVTLARAKSTVTFPARMVLAATMNPCPCGYDGYEDQTHRCKCSTQRKQGYLAKLSGPLLDRMDMHLDIPRLSPVEALQLVIPIRDRSANEMSSQTMADAAKRAQQIQEKRYLHSTIRYNSELSGRYLHEVCRLDTETSRILIDAYASMGLSARAHARVLKVARTIADLESKPNIEVPHLVEALFYRSLDQRLLRLTEQQRDFKEG
jgi:magnesium chelatase family protein